jgi:hypothetical protein
MRVVDVVEVGIQRLKKAKVEFDEVSMRACMERLKARLVH